MTDELKPYEMMLNYQIEQAFKTQEDKFTYTHEYCLSKPDERDTILRKYLIKEFSGEVPANWKPMKVIHSSSGSEQDSKAIADHETQKCQGKIQPGYEVDFQKGAAAESNCFSAFY
ncbi:hypothetical protein MAR_015725 [Mya arenaria]|uniref:Uncharacterized protein n=1 Tax=Mya arenaria TaxID=6604 RepID=A0ABY7FLE2_MYAAR|nr:hypothetical protein MAR_015725 [Mya arenaria]